jgi:LCP family protein required for cell wall assembly
MPHGARRRDPDDFEMRRDRGGPAASRSYPSGQAPRGSGSRGSGSGGSGSGGPGFRSSAPPGSGSRGSGSRGLGPRGSAPRGPAPRGPAPRGPAPRGPVGGPPGRGRQPGLRQARETWRRKTGLAKAGYIIASLVAVVAVVAGIGGFAIYRQLDGNITKVNVGGLSGRTIYGSQNILVLGSQTRLGQRGNFGYDANPGVSNSDNLLLIHLDPTHTHAIVLSIPRDTFVYEPACRERKYVGTGTWPAQQYPPGAIIDGALNIGGPTCAVQTVEALTGIKLDHFVEFDFNSFRTMVGQLGGVQVCVPPGPGYHDRATNLNLSPGKHLLNYGQALQYVRDRHGVGGGTDAGGDLPRIQLQQAFISSVVQKVNSTGLLSDVPSLLRIADTATKALTVDDALGSTTSLLRLAESLAHLKSKNVTLITMPSTMDTYNYPSYSTHLMTVEPQDDVLFQMIRTGQAWTGALPVQPYSSVQVHVMNATGQGGLATRTRTALRKLGFDVVSVGDAPYSATTTVNYAGLAQADAAYSVMTALKATSAGQNTLVEPAPQAGSPGPVTLILGANFAGVNPPAVVKPAVVKPAAKKGKHRKHSTSVAGQPAPSGSAGAVEARNAGASICSGLPPAYTPGG